MYNLLVILHMTVCFLLVVIVLLQSGRSGGFQGIFGSSGEVIFSTPSGSSFLRKVTIGFAVAFGVSSLTLTIMTKSRMYLSVIFEEPLAAPQTPPPGQAP